MKKILLLLLLSSLLMACGGSKTDVEKYQNLSDQQIFAGADQALVKGNFKEAVARYESMEVLYPYGEYAQQTQLNIIYGYYREREYDHAAAAAERYIRLYPSGPYTDYAYYMKGLSEFSRSYAFFERNLPMDISARNMDNIQQSFTDFNFLIHRYPNSMYAPDARQRMVFLRNLLAKHELDIAKYYYARKAYVAAAEQGNYVITTFEHAPQVADALVVMANSYQKLNLQAEKQRTVDVIKLNYPEKLKEVKDK